jgi:hypothetical protein
MSAQINFLAGQNFAIQNLSGSGLGFYGDAGFGASVQVGAWQGHTFITDGAGVNQGPEVNNVKYLNAGSGILGQSGSGVALTAIPNYQATLNVRFTYDTPVKVQNAQLFIYDRVNPNNPASGVTTAVAEVIHPAPTQTNNGSGNTTWTFPAGSGTVLALSNSPGTSGLYAGNGSNSLWTDTQHDFYLCLSASPLSIGSKSQYGLYVSLNYL